MGEARKIELGIFDLDGTLYPFKCSKQDTALYDADMFTEIRIRGEEYISRVLKIGIEEARKLREEVSQRHNGAVSIGLEKEFRIDRMSYFENVWNLDPRKYLERNDSLRNRLADMKIKKAILTTSPRIWAERALKELGVRDLFVGVWTGEGDIRKPNEQAYLQVTEFYQVDPKRTLIVEDQPKNLIPAKKLGMLTILVGRQDNPVADIRIENINQIEKITRFLRGEK